MIAVDLLTGFLGSGKTTLLRGLLQAPELADALVLVNELGEVGLDHLLLERLEGDVVLLRSGCVCCTIRTDLRDMLASLVDRRARGRLPPFARIVVETTGLADPAPIVQTLSADPVLRHQLRLGAIVTVVDAVNGPATLARYPEARHQVAVADRIVVTKTDLAPPLAAASAVQRINPVAEIVTLSPDDGPAPPALLTAPAVDAALRLAVPTAHGHGEIAALCLRRDEPLDWAAFAVWFSLLLHRHGTRLLRAKGLLHIAGVATPVVIHGVQHVIHTPSHLPAWPDGRAATTLVLIVDGLDRGAIQRSFAAFMAGSVAAS